MTQSKSRQLGKKPKAETEGSGCLCTSGHKGHTCNAPTCKHPSGMCTWCRNGHGQRPQHAGETKKTGWKLLFN